MEEQEKKLGIMDMLEMELKKSHQRQEFFRDEHILQMQPPLTSIQEYEVLLSRWIREKLLKVVSSFVRDEPEAAEDIVQQALLRGYLNLKNGGPYSVPRKMLKELKAMDDASQNLDLNQQEVRVDNPSAWMYTILRNTAQNYAGMRERERAIMMSQLKLELEDPRFERVDIVVECKERDDELHGHVAALPHPYSQIIRQRFFEGVKLKDIADELGYPHSTVRVYLNRGVQMLKEIYIGERVVKGGRMTKKRRQASSRI